MKLLPEIQKIFDGYDLKPIEIPEGYKNVYDTSSKIPEFKNQFLSDKDDGYFIHKYSAHIPRGWYGFSIGTPIVPEWNEIIDMILEICIANDPDFEIHQIKLKWGCMYFSVDSDVIEDTSEIDVLIMQTLYDKALIY